MQEVGPLVHLCREQESYKILFPQLIAEGSQGAQELCSPLGMVWLCSSVCSEYLIHILGLVVTGNVALTASQLPSFLCTYGWRVAVSSGRCLSTVASGLVAGIILPVLSVYLLISCLPPGV